MELDAFMGLMRLTVNDDKVIANLAQIALNLAKGIRDAEARAELAEAALNDERTKIAGFMAAVQQGMDGAAPARFDPSRFLQISRETVLVSAS